MSKAADRAKIKHLYATLDAAATEYQRIVKTLDDVLEYMAPIVVALHDAYMQGYPLQGEALHKLMEDAGLRRAHVGTDDLLAYEFTPTYHAFAEVAKKAAERRDAEAKAKRSQEDAAKLLAEVQGSMLVASGNDKVGP